MKKAPYTEDDMRKWLVKMNRYTEKEGRTTEYPKRGDVWTMDFGLTVGSEIHRVRPVVVISSSIVNEKNSTILLAPITTRSASESESTLDFHMELKDEYFEWGAEKVSGIIKTEAVTTLSKGRLGKRIGRLNGDGIDKLTQLIGKSLHVPEPISPGEERQKRDPR